MRRRRIVALFCAVFAGFAVTAASAGEADAASSPPTGLWKVVGLGDKPLSGPTLEINGDRVSGHGGCNRYSGPVAIKGTSVHFGPLAATRMACDRLDVEQAFFDALEKVRSYSADGERLVLMADDGAPLLYLAR